MEKNRCDLTNYMIIRAEIGKNPELTEETLLNRIKTTMDFVFQIPGIVVNCSRQNCISRIELRYENADSRSILDLLKLTTVLNEQYFDLFMKNERDYELFIANVPLSTKTRLTIQKPNIALIYFETDMIAEFRSLFNSYNKILPKTFIGAYFEEILTGFIGFFRDLSDFDFIFRKERDAFSGLRWLKDQGFAVSENIVMKKMQEIYRNLQNTSHFQK